MLEKRFELTCMVGSSRRLSIYGTSYSTFSIFVALRGITPLCDFVSVTQKRKGARSSPSAGVRPFMMSSQKPGRYTRGGGSETRSSESQCTPTWARTLTRAYARAHRVSMRFAVVTLHLRQEAPNPLREVVRPC